MDALAAFALTGVAHGLSAAVMGALVIGEAVILVAAFIAARLARTLEIAGIGPFEITARIVPAAAEIIVATVSGPVALIELVALAVPIIATVLASMVLHTRMAQTAFEIRTQQIELNELEAQAWSMQAQIEKAASASELEKAATAQGMVKGGQTGFINLGAGTIEGGTAGH